VSLVSCAYDIAVNDCVERFPCLPVARLPLPAGCPDGVKIPGGLKTPLILYHRKNMIAFLVFRREL